MRVQPLKRVARWGFLRWLAVSIAVGLCSLSLHVFGVFGGVFGVFGDVFGVGVGFGNDDAGFVEMTPAATAKERCKGSAADAIKDDDAERVYVYELPARFNTDKLQAGVRVAKATVLMYKGADGNAAGGTFNDSHVAAAWGQPCTMTLVSDTDKAESNDKTVAACPVLASLPGYKMRLTEQYALELIAHHRMLNHPRRVFDISKATLAFVPWYGFCAGWSPLAKNGKYAPSQQTAEFEAVVVGSATVHLRVMSEVDARVHSRTYTRRARHRICSTFHTTFRTCLRTEM
jgi:hypothetical protein